MKKTIIMAAAALALAACCSQPKFDGPTYLNPNAPVEERVEDALARMTLEEKVKIIHAQSKFSSAGVPRLVIPELWTTDGPHGIRPEVLWDEWEQAGWTNDSCVAFPALTCLAATWNEDMSALYGKSIGEEARFREKDILLEPGETKTVTFSIDPEKLMYFDDEKHEWVLEDGKFTAYVGSASDDIRTQVSFEVR